MYIQEVDTKHFEDFDDHERVVRCEDKDAGLLAFIAIHNRNLGPALGGCRIQPYQNESEAITDVLRLSRGMTYKSAMAGLPLGGGKSVIVADPKTDKTDALFTAMGKFIDNLKGHYIGAEDSGTTVDDLKVMATQTRHVAGIHNRQLKNGQTASGDPSPSTAYGVYVGIKTSVQYKLNTDSLSGVKIAVHGVGNVGRNLVKLLVADGAEVYVADRWQPAIDRICEESRVTVINNDILHKANVDVYAPCALGSSLNTDTLVAMQAPIVAGAANNQLANSGAGEYLYHKGILYAPDYVINAGGIIDIYYEQQMAAEGFDHAKVLEHIDGIAPTLREIYDNSARHNLPTHVMANKLAEARFLGKKISEVA